MPQPVGSVAWVGRETVQAAMRTPDGVWRVEVVRRGPDSCWYRIVHGTDVLDWLGIGSVERILAEEGVDLASLVPADDEPPGRQHGVA